MNLNLSVAALHHVGTSLFDSASPLSNPLNRVALNPQPLPPGERFSAHSLFKGPLDQVTLNPQPLPPREGAVQDASTTVARPDLSIEGNTGLQSLMSQWTLDAAIASQIAQKTDDAASQIIRNIR